MKRLLPVVVLWLIFGKDLKLAGFIVTPTKAKPAITGHVLYEVKGSTRTATIHGALSSLAEQGSFVVYESSRAMVRTSGGAVMELKL